MKKPRICPNCGKTYTEPPALSREDNKTAICPDCGVSESLIAAGIREDVQEQILEAIHNARYPSAAATA